MSVHHDEIPAPLLPYIDAFLLDTKAKIRRVVTRSSDSYEGWVLDLGFERALYNDGVIAGKPAYRAYEELGFPGGEDDFQTDDDWRRHAQRERELFAMYALPLKEAYALAQQYGYTNTQVAVGEQVLVDGQSGVVTFVDGDTYSASTASVKVQLADGVEVAVALVELYRPGEHPPLQTTHTIPLLIESAS